MIVNPIRWERSVLLRSVFGARVCVSRDFVKKNMDTELFSSKKIMPVFDAWMHAKYNKKTLETYSPESCTIHSNTIATQTPRIAAMI